jgi:hypothetical protein
MSPTEPRAPRRPPSFGRHLKWSLLMVAASLVIALLAIPILRWLGLSMR